MKCKLASIARKSGSFLNDKGKEINYDNVILYALVPVNTFKTEKSCFEGAPVALTEVKIPVKNWLDIVNVTYDSLPNYIGENFEVLYDMAEFNGTVVPKVCKVVF